MSGGDSLPAFPASRWMCSFALNAFCRHAWWAVPTLVIAGTEPTSRLLFAYMCEMTDSDTSVAAFLLGLIGFDAANISLSKDKPLLIVHSAASAESNHTPRVAIWPSGLSCLFSHATSTIRYLLLSRSFSSVIFLIASSWSSGSLMFSVGVWWATTPNRGLTSFVPLPNSLSHSVLFRAVSVDR